MKSGKLIILVIYIIMYWILNYLWTSSNNIEIQLQLFTIIALL